MNPIATQPLASPASERVHHDLRATAHGRRHDRRAGLLLEEATLGTTGSCTAGGCLRPGGDSRPDARGALAGVHLPWLRRIAPGRRNPARTVPRPSDLAAHGLQAQASGAPPTRARRAADAVLHKEDPVFLAIRYAECDARPVRRALPTAGAATRQTANWSRDPGLVGARPAVAAPRRVRLGALADQGWRDAAQAAAAAGEPLPAPARPAAADEPWVMLARGSRAARRPPSPRSPRSRLRRGCCSRRGAGRAASRLTAT